MAMRRKVIAGATAALVVGGSGAGLAATKLMRPSAKEDNAAIVNDAAKTLGVSPSKLNAALAKAISDRIDAAVAAGQLTKAQGEALKQRIESGDFPLFGPLGFGLGFGPGFGFHGPGPAPLFHAVDAAAAYLGLSEAQVKNKLNQGQSLAQIARAQHKSVSGLESALLADVKVKLDRAVSDGRLTKAKEQEVLKDLQSRIDDLVNGQLRLRFKDRGGFGFRDRGGFGFKRYDGQGPLGPPPLDPAA